MPRFLRGPLFRWFAGRYGAELGDIEGDIQQFRSMQAFFRRSLRADARPVAADANLVWPCDGRIVTVGAIADGRIEQVKGNDYELADLLGDNELAMQLEGGQQATIYLAPGDYHRVHSPFAGCVERVAPLRGTLFPVNPPAVRSIDRLFVRNSRHVFHCRTANGTPAAVVMVGAYNVGGTRVTVESGAIECGQELGQFGFGSTVVVAIGRGGGTFAELAPEHKVRMGEAADAVANASAPSGE
ncbi:MAG: archaetidylserine decarboxylase [Planctomycetota bacterium]